MAVEVIIEAADWEAVGIGALAERAVHETLRHLGLDPDRWDVAVLACGDKRIAELNAEFRDRAGATNVLSWPSAERRPVRDGVPPAPPVGGPELGDIALAWETCVAEASAAGRPVADHAAHLVVHGTLHLLGYDHERDGDGDLMEATEIAILERLGVPDPYRGQGTGGGDDCGKD